MNADKTVGGSALTRDEYIRHVRPTIPHASQYAFDALLEAAFNPPDHSRGLRDGLERAAEEARLTLVQLQPRPGHPDDRAAFAYAAERVVTDLVAIRAEASRLDGEERECSYCHQRVAVRYEAHLVDHACHAPEPPAERAVMQCAGCQGPLSDCVCGAEERKLPHRFDPKPWLPESCRVLVAQDEHCGQPRSAHEPTR